MILALGLIAWGGLAVLLGIAIGRTIREADRRAAVTQRRGALEQDWLADQPLEVLAPAEWDARLVAGRSTKAWLL